MKSPLNLSNNAPFNKPNPNRLPAMAQVGWIGLDGCVYALDDEATARKEQPGGYQPLSIQYGEWILDESDGSYDFKD